MKEKEIFTINNIAEIVLIENDNRGCQVLIPGCITYKYNNENNGKDSPGFYYFNYKEDAIKAIVNDFSKRYNINTCLVCKRQGNMINKLQRIEIIDELILEEE